MILTTENVLLVGSILLFVSILAVKASGRFGIPTLIFFLCVGMLAGSEGIGGIYFNDARIAKFIGVVALNFILFSGGLDTDWNYSKPILWQGISLSTVGVVITAASLGILVHYLTDFTLYEGLLLGAIVSSTDAAAVFSILRASKLGLKYKLRPTLELESGSNDPMAYFLTIAFLGLVMHPEKSFWTIIPLFFQEVLIGGAMGYLMGRFSKKLINRINLEFEGLYPLLMIVLMFITFTLTDTFHGNGFLAVYICAVYVGNQAIIHKKTILKSFDGVAWIMQIILFLTLGLLVYPSHVVRVMDIGIILSLALIFIIRPLSVYISLLPFKGIRNNSKAFLSWVGLRGAVPIVFATYPLLAGVHKSHMIFNIVFFISISSVLLQGTTLKYVAKLLRVTAPPKSKAKIYTYLEVTENSKHELTEIILPADYKNKKKLVDMDFPNKSLITMIKRNDKYITPNGSSVLMANDTLFILSENKETLDVVKSLLNV